MEHILEQSRELGYNAPVVYLKNKEQQWMDHYLVFILTCIWFAPLNISENVLTSYRMVVVFETPTYTQPVVLQDNIWL